MVMKQVELSQRFYKKQKLQKLANKIIEEWEHNPGQYHNLRDIKNHINSICELSRGWTDKDYDSATKELLHFKEELKSSPVVSSNIPKLTELLIASLNMVNAGVEDKCSAVVEAFYRTNGFMGLEQLCDYMTKLIKKEHDRQTVAASMQGFYDPSQIPAIKDRTQIPQDHFKL